MDKALPSRRDELLELAATMFAERGLRATTVRDIADSAGILSGSLYHHFKSKEQMVEEVLRDFLDWLFAPLPGDRRRARPIRSKRVEGLFMASFEAIEHRHAQVVIYQDEAKRLSSLPQFGFVDDRNREQRKMWVDVLKQGVAEGCFRPDLDVDLVYRFIRDTTWVSVRWYQPGGPLTAEQVGRQYLAIVLGGITDEGDVRIRHGRGVHHRRRTHRGRQAQRRAGRAFIPSTSGRPPGAGCSTATTSTPAPSPT